MLQPPLFTTSVKTAEVVFLGVITQRGTIVTIKPKIWPKSETVSIAGNILAPRVLKKMVTTRKASIINVYCQFGNENPALKTWTMAWTRVVRTKTLLDTLASQPKVDIHPRPIVREVLDRLKWSFYLPHS